MKKIAFVLAIAMISATAAFAGGGGERGFRADAFWYSFADTFLASVRADMTAEFARANLALQHHDANNSQTVLVDQIRTAITRGTSVLIVNIVTTGSEDAAMTIVNMARDANVPLLWFNREVSNAVVNSYPNSVFVGTDADEAGVMQGQAIADFLLRADNWTGARSNFDLNGDGVINYIMLRGEHGNAEAFGRTLHSVTTANRLLAARGLRLAPSPANVNHSPMYADDGISNFFLYANWSAAIANDLMNTALAAHSLTSGAIELIVANNDDAALGAISALNGHGFNTGAAGAGYIPVFGVDATAAAQEAIRAGRMTGTILQDGTEMARTVLFLARNIAEGRPMNDGIAARFNVDSGVAKIRVPHAIFN
ncbi:MAG: galactose ABC transporter substrate-binding protein [Treponema sp.]|nr:galactose ABC transporter substrate-binding protein [Treponema sp.]